MRAAEFITEAPAKTNREHVSTMPPSLVYPDMDTGYEYYRFMTVVAAHPHHKAPPVSYTHLTLPTIYSV